MTRVAKLSSFQKTARVEPYLLDLENGTTVTFNRPNLRALDELAGAQTPRDILRVLAGDQFEDAYAVIGELEVGDFEALIEDILSGLGISNGESDPTKR